MKSYQPAQALHDRSYIGLVLSQFLAAFNDQAIHITAIFYASDMLHGYVQSSIDQKAIVSIVTAGFISPFFLFSPLAGILADKYSKQKTIVFWKFSEVFITGLALFAFLLPHWASPDGMKTAATVSAWLLILAVFFMGTHSAFFVPAKYGVMPELLHGSILSRGNGLLEGTSFVSQILGTAFGGYLYFYTKSKVNNELPGGLAVGNEWIIGAVLFGLALVGAALSLLVAKIPAAAPDRVLTFNPLKPLQKNFGELRRSRPLVLATIGIAFFTFMTLFVRQTLLFQGETTKELNAARARLTAGVDTASETAVKGHGTAQQLDELWIATLVALVGFGVGGGCAIAGKASGSRLELGLVPIGTVSLIALTGLLSIVAEPAPALDTADGLLPAIVATASQQWPTIVCLIAIGFAAGLYIVPLYTLLQHRAPKDSKGNMVATSNFLNVTGGLLAVGMFFGVTFLFQNLRGNDIRRDDAALLADYVAQLERHEMIPAMLFLFAAGMTLLMLLLFLRIRPDFLLRTWSYFTLPQRRSLRAVQADKLPSYGPALLVANTAVLRDWLQIISVVDRSVLFAWQAAPEDRQLGRLVAWTRRLRVGLPLEGDGPDAIVPLLGRARETLAAGNLFGMAWPEREATRTSICQELSRYQPLIIPVYCGPTTADALVNSVVIGEPLSFGSDPVTICQAIDNLRPLVDCVTAGH